MRFIYPSVEFQEELLILFFSAKYKTKHFNKHNVANLKNTISLFKAGLINYTHKHNISSINKVLI